MATTRLEKAQWQPYFDRISRGLGGQEVEIEVAGLGLGDQIEREWTRLNGLVYDPKDDVFEVVTDEVDHLVAHPKDIYVEEAEGTMLRSVEVVDTDDNHQIVRLRAPLSLPPG